MLEAELGVSAKPPFGGASDLDEDQMRTSTPPPDGPSPRRSILGRMGSPFMRSASASPFLPSATPPGPAPASLGGLPSRIPASHDHIPGHQASSMQSSLSSLASSTTLGSTGGAPRRLSPRISQENVQLRLAKKRSRESPLRELGPDELFSPQPVTLARLVAEEEASMDAHSLGSTAEDAQDAVLGTAQRQTLGMRSALDRLVSDVASDVGSDAAEAFDDGARASVASQEDHMQQDEEDDEEEEEEEDDASMDVDHYASAPEDDDRAPATHVHVSPPRPPTKHLRAQREEEILRRRRTARRRDEDERMGRATPPRDVRPPNASPIGRPIPLGHGHGRAKSEGAAAVLDDALELGLITSIGEEERSRLADSIARELRRKDPGKSVSRVALDARIVLLTTGTEVLCARARGGRVCNRRGARHPLSACGRHPRRQGVAPCAAAFGHGKACVHRICVHH
jgi:hypothetical protein